MTYNQVLLTLPKLSRKELEQVQHRVKFLLSTANPHDAAEGDDATFVLNVICSVLSKMGVEFAIPSVLRKMSSYPSFARKVPVLIDYLDKAKIRSKRERSAVLSIGVSLLQKNLTRLQIPCDASMIMRHVHRIPACLECEFPNYAAAGLLSKIVIREGDMRVRQKPSSKPNGGSRQSDSQRSVLHTPR